MAQDKKVKSTAASEAKQVGRFGLVGVINTLLDFGLYNLFSRGSTVTSVLIQANFISTTAAMIFSFVANKQFVFKAKGGSFLKQAVWFFIITASGLYLLQNGIIYFFKEIWSSPLNWASSIVDALGLDGIFKDDFVVKNGAKAIATVGSLIWNYLWYKKFVFKK